MIGVFAMLDRKIYFNELLQKSNLQPCEFPLDNWMTGKGFFIPLAAHSVAVFDVLESTDKRFYQELDVPPLCGILITPKMHVYEVGASEGQLRLRSVPMGTGVLYVRAHHRDLEEAYTAALRITRDLPKATELASKATVSLPGKPIYTSVPVAAWAALKKDAGIIRTLTDVKLKKLMQAVVNKEKKKEEQK